MVIFSFVSTYSHTSFFFCSTCPKSENVALKSSIEECTRTIQLMHSEMKGLKTIANSGVSKMRLRENSLMDEHRKDRDAIAEMERKLENANNLIRSLQSSSGQYDVQRSSLFSNLDGPSPSVSRLKTPEERRSTHRSRFEEFHDLPSGSTTDGRKFAAELSTEKELRFKAEEICAGGEAFLLNCILFVYVRLVSYLTLPLHKVLANSKAALEERDSEISKLRAQLFKISSKRYKGDRR